MKMDGCASSFAHKREERRRRGFLSLVPKFAAADDDTANVAATADREIKGNQTRTSERDATTRKNLGNLSIPCPTHTHTHTVHSTHSVLCVVSMVSTRLVGWWMVKWGLHMSLIQSFVVRSLAFLLLFVSCRCVCDQKGATQGICFVREYLFFLLFLILKARINTHTHTEKRRRRWGGSEKGTSMCIRHSFLVAARHQPPPPRRIPTQTQISRSLFFLNRFLLFSMFCATSFWIISNCAFSFKFELE